MESERWSISLGGEHLLVWTEFTDEISYSLLHWERLFAIISLTGGQTSVRENNIPHSHIGATGSGTVDSLLDRK